MAKIDIIYHDLLKDILENGTRKADRTGTGTISVFGRQLRYDMGNGFPLLTTKRLHTKSIFHELLWFLQGDTNIKYLAENGVSIWNEWPYKKYCENYIKENPAFSGPYEDKQLSQEEFIEKIITDNEFAQKWGDLGPVYGKQWVSWESWQDATVDEDDRYGNRSAIEKVTVNQIHKVIDSLRNKPDDRRMMVTAWNPAQLDNVALPPCHYGFQMWTRELTTQERLEWAKNAYSHLVDEKSWVNLFANEEAAIEWFESFDIGKLAPKRKLSLMWNQRSVDTFLGLPFNIASYAFLLEMFAQQANMIAGELICNLGDTHIYTNHVDYVKQQLERDVNKHQAPKLLLNKAHDIDSYKFEDFTIEGYTYYPNWKNVPIAV